MEADSQLTPCFSTGCSGICLIEDGLRRFYCPICSKLNCLDCKTTHESPCKKRRRRKVVEEADSEGIMVVDLLDSEEEEDPEDLKGQIAMKLPVAETEDEAKLRTEWEASWEQLVAKFSSEKEIKEEGTQKKRPWEESVSHLGVFSELITTDHVFECPICIVDVEIGEGVILQDCFHRFCRDCLAASIQHAEEPRVKCPYQSGNYSCQMHILDREVKALVSEEVYDKFLKKSLSAAEMGMSNAFHCQSVNCTGWAEIDERVATFRCFICTKSNCVPCKAIHDSLTCAEYQSRLREGECDVASKEALNRMINKGDAMRCPTCKVVIIKNGGCDGMTCVVCQTHICWATKGPRWGPKGRGDETGGCRCGFEGKKCHPKCGNCH